MTDLQPTVPKGFATYAGLVFTLVGVVGTTIAALKANDVATATAGVGTTLTAITLVGGRMAQAVAAFRAAVIAASPAIDAVQAAAKDKPES